MKYIIMLCLFFIGSNAFGQWSSDELQPFKDRAEQEIRCFVDGRIADGKWDVEFDSCEIEFVVDTLRIEKVIELLNDAGKYTTLDMHNQVYFMMSEWDKLLNKYYNKLMSKLTDADKVKLRDAQRAWLKYRDSDGVLNSDLLDGSYQGGGSMWRVLSGSRSVEVLKERVLYLYFMFTCV